MIFQRVFLKQDLIKVACSVDVQLLVTFPWNFVELFLVSSGGFFVSFEAKLSKSCHPVTSVLF